MTDFDTGLYYFYATQDLNDLTFLCSTERLTFVAEFAPFTGGLHC